MKEIVAPAEALKGTVNLPPDKSISHRSALFAALSEEISVISNYSPAADPQSTLSCLGQLGVQVEKEGRKVTINGVGRDGFKIPGKPLDCGNSGTTMRLLSGILAGAGIESELRGDPSLSARTMKRIIDPLRMMNAEIEARDGIYAPLRIHSHRGIKPLHYPLPIASAQLKSCVLLAGLFGESPTEVIESTPSRDHTERLLELKIELRGKGKMIRSSRADHIPSQTYTVPGDFSAAAFWMVGAAIHKDSRLTLQNVGINPTRTGLLDILKEMGASIQVINERTQGKEPVADLVISSSELKPLNVDPALIPNCIDELPVLMVALCFAGGKSVISGAAELRHKETDRLEAMHTILTLAGARADLLPDGMIIYGKTDFKPRCADFPTYHDHRMAMAAAILASLSDQPSAISDAECTAISYPDFWSHLQNVSV